MNIFAPSTLEGLHQGKNDPMDVIAAKVFFKEKSFKDFIKKTKEPL